MSEPEPRRRESFSSVSFVPKGCAHVVKQRGIEATVTANADAFVSISLQPAKVGERTDIELLQPRKTLSEEIRAEADRLASLLLVAGWEQEDVVPSVVYRLGQIAKALEEG